MDTFQDLCIDFFQWVEAFWPIAIQNDSQLVLFFTHGGYVFHKVVASDQVVAFQEDAACESIWAILRRKSSESKANDPFEIMLSRHTLYAFSQSTIRILFPNPVAMIAPALVPTTRSNCRCNGRELRLQTQIHTHSATHSALNQHSSWQREQGDIMFADMSWPRQHERQSVRCNIMCRVSVLVIATRSHRHDFHKTSWPGRHEVQIEVTRQKSTTDVIGGPDIFVRYHQLRWHYTTNSFVKNQQTTRRASWWLEWWPHVLTPYARAVAGRSLRTRKRYIAVIACSKKTMNKIVVENETNCRIKWNE